MKLTVLLLALTIVVGCATKRYTIAQPLSSAEIDLLGCDGLKLELLRANQVQNQINETGAMDGRTVAGFLGDFGIGNAMAKQEAQEAVTQRTNEILSAQAALECS